MIQIGKNFLLGLSEAQQSNRARHYKYKELALDAQTQAQALQEKYRQRMAYLFRTSNEKMRLAYDNARKELAHYQALRAAHGITEDSASAAEQTQTAAHTQALEAQRMAEDVQNSGAKETNLFQDAWQKLLASAAAYRRKSKQKGSLGSLGQALVSLFK